jgi:tryptophanyl-tRNA synthetase
MKGKSMRILSGIQPSGVLHIGNYFGMMRPAIALQAEGEAFYFIADYHALTSVRDPKALAKTFVAWRSISSPVDLIRSALRCSGNRTCRK